MTTGRTEELRRYYRINFKKTEKKIGVEGNPREGGRRHTGNLQRREVRIQRPGI